MFDNLTGTVGTLMHDDRLARAAKDRQLAEATTAKPHRNGTHGSAFRDGIANALLTLATRLSPSIENRKSIAAS